MSLRIPKYLLRLIALSLFLGALPVFFLGSYSYFKSTGVVKHEAIENNKSLLFQTEMRVEQLLTGVDTSVAQFITSPIVTTMSDRELSQNHYEAFNELTKNLSNLQKYDGGVEDVTFVNLDKHWIVNNKIAESLDELPNRNLIEQYANLSQNSIWLPEAPREQIPRGMSTTKGVNLIKKIPLNPLLPYGILIVKLPMTKLQETLSQDGMQREIMILDANYRLITSNQEGGMSGKPELKNELIDRLQMENSSGFFQYNRNNFSYGITFRKSNYNEWIYVSIISMEAVSKELRSIGWFTVFISLSTVLVLFIISVYLSRRMYSPIRQLYNLVMPFSKSEAAHDRDEFKFIGQRIRYMHSAKDKLEKQLQGQLDQIREHFMMKLLKGKVNAEEIRDWLQAYQHARSWNQVYVLSARIDTLEGTRYGEKDRDLLLFSINNVAAELVPDRQRLIPILIDDFQVMVIGSCEEDHLAEVSRLAEHIQETVEKLLHLAISIGISSAFQDIKYTSTAFLESTDALNYRVKLGRASILRMDDIRSKLGDAARYPEETATELVDAIKRLDEDKIDDRLDLFMNQLFNKDLKFQAYQMALIRLISDLNRIAENFGESLGSKPESAAENKTLIEQLFELKTAEEIKQWFRHTIIDMLMQLVHRQQQTQYRSISEKMIAIIHEHYHSDLTLESCATMLNYHPNYIKRVFRNETGDNFSDYLTQYRMKVAKKMLVETNVKVSDIAVKIGYSSSQNFIRYFRKVEGVTPGQYREGNAQ